MEYAADSTLETALACGANNILYTGWGRWGGWSRSSRAGGTVNVIGKVPVIVSNGESLLSSSQIIHPQFQSDSEHSSAKLSG